MAICSALNCAQRATIKASLSGDNWEFHGKLCADHYESILNILNPKIIMNALLIAVARSELEQSFIEMEAHGSS